MEQKKSSFGDKVTDILATIIHFVRQNKKMVAIGGIATLGLILIIIGTTRSDPVEMVQEFEKAVVMGDTKKLSRLVIPGDKELKIDEKRLQQFVEYAQKDQDYFQEQIWILQAQTAYHTESDEIVYYSMEGMTTKELLEAGDFYIKKGNFLWFDTYEIAARPMYLKLTTNEADVVLQIDGEEVFKTTKKKKSYTYGPVMPGIYEATAEKEFEFANLKAKDEVNLFHSSGIDMIVAVDLELVGESVEVYSKVKGTTVFANGKKVGLVEEVEKLEPITKDGKIKIHGEAKLPWGVSKSEPSYVYEDDEIIDITPNPTSDEKVKKEITTLINTYAKERSKAYATKDTSGVTTLTGKEKESFIDEIKRFKRNEGYYKGKPIKTKIDYGGAEFNQDEDSGDYYIAVPVELHYNQKKYSRWCFCDRNGPPEDVKYRYTMHVIYDSESSKWLITNMEELYFNNHDMRGVDVVESNLE